MINPIKNINYTRWAFINFVVLALFGVLLRYLLVFHSGGLNYLYILHAHSHFAFAGWTFLALAVLIVKLIREEASTAFRWIFLLTLISSFGMLISFSFQGYKAVSITFSTLFLFITYWFGYLVYKKLDNKKHGPLTTKLIKASIWFLVISSVGPLALGALRATGNTGIIYQNAIYFYLNFQMNGWMLLAVLALIFNNYFKTDASATKCIGPWLNLFTASVAPLFFIFTLWSKPPQWVFLIAFVAAFLNTISWFAILYKLKSFIKKIPLLIQVALLAISLKVLFQILVCVPQISEWTFQNRNLIIGYVHLLTLGCVTPVLINQFTVNNSAGSFRLSNYAYITVTITYLTLLFIQPLFGLFNIIIPFYQHYLLFISLLYCRVGLSYYIRFSGTGKTDWHFLTFRIVASLGGLWTLFNLNRNN